MDSIPPNPNPPPRDKPSNIPKTPPISTLTNQQMSSSPTPPLSPTPSPTLSSPPPVVPSESSSQLPVKKDINFLSKALLVLGPLIMVGLFGVSFYNLTKAPQKPIQAPVKPTDEKIIVEEKTKEIIKEIYQNSPKNPDQVSAKCLSTGEDLISEQPTSCSDPQFAWTGEEPQEPGTKIIGYYVYFDTNDNDSLIPYSDLFTKSRSVIRPYLVGQFQKENTISPQNLQKGVTYYLAVTAKSNSQNRLWRFGYSDVDVENLEARFAKVLFVYQYE